MRIDSDSAGALATLDNDPDTDGWLLVLVAPATWALLDAIGRLGGRPSRSVVANDLLRRSLSVSGDFR